MYLLNETFSEKALKDVMNSQLTMSEHMKRLVAPRAWPIPRKTSDWVVKPRPGAHPIERGIPLLLVVRDILGYCDIAREAKRIISNGEILVDGGVVKDYKRPIGVMDVLAVPKAKQYFRVLIDAKGRLKMVPITELRAKSKLVRVKNKKVVKGGKVQINCHDGRNILLSKNKYKTGDTLRIETPSQKILKSYALKKGNLAIAMGGKHVGEKGRIKEIKVVRSSKPNLVILDKFSTIKDHVFVIGEKRAVIKLP